MKVVLVSHSPGLHGGAERSLLELARYLQAKSSVNLSVIVPSKDEIEKICRAEGIRCVVIPYYWAEYRETDTEMFIDASLGALQAIRSWLKEEAPDIVMTNTAAVPWFGYACQLLGIPHVWFLRELVTEDGRLDLYPSRDQALNFINRYSDCLMVNSNFMKDRYEKALGSSKPISVVYPSINQDILRFAKPSAHKKGGAISLLVFGSVSPGKNQMEILRAAKLLLARTPNFHVTIMGATGSQQYKNELLEYVSAHNLGDRVSFEGHTNEPYAAVSRHDICIVPSVNEPFGRVTVEAMLLGKVVVASDSGGTREVAENAPGAFLYKPGDAKALSDTLFNLINEPESLEALGVSARDYAVKQFLHGSNLETFYKTLQKTARLRKEPRDDWIGSRLLEKARQLPQVRSSLNELEQKAVSLESAVAAEKQETAAILSSRRWKIATAVARPISWLRNLFR